MSNWDIEEIAIEDIRGYDDNTKEHTAEQISEIRDSIVSFGYNDPIAVDENNVIIEGHGRLAAIKQIFSDNSKKIKVLKLSGLNEDQKRAYRIAHNKLNQKTGLDEDKLAKEFNLLKDTDYFNCTGFSTNEITKIWEKATGENNADSGNVVESEKASVISHTCPECGHSWETEIKKSNKRV